MRTCPKEEETVETCDGMNQKNMIFDNCSLQKKEKNEKNYKKKRKLRTFRNSYEIKNLIFLSKFLAFIGFLLALGDKNFSISKSL